jgi:FAD/FMN-containing dehydrogenase
MEKLAIRDVDGNEIIIDGAEIERFASHIQGQVLFAGDPGYEDARRVWNKMIDRRPALIVQCADADDVVACVRLAAKHKLLTSVRGGGHNVAGNAVNDDGLVIDLSMMRRVVVNRERMTATVQGGARLSDVDVETQKYGLATPLGVVPRTGVAGLALHGGLGWLLRRLGTTADNIVGAEVVTADGSLLIVNESENPDLLWALRGGGGNFGVVTSFELRLHEVGPKVWAGLIIYSLDDIHEVLPKFVEHMSGAPDELTANLQFWSTPPLPSMPASLVGRPTLTVTVCYSGPLERGEATLSPLKLFGAPLYELTMPVEFMEMQNMGSSLGEEGGEGSRHYWKSIFLNELSAEAVEVLRTAAERRPSELSTMTVYYLGGAFARLGAEASFDNREQRFLVSLEADWDEPKDDDANVRWARDAFDALRENARARVYLNFPGMAEEENMAEDSFAENLARLREIKAKYDPENLFRGRLSVRPSVRTAERTGR